MGAGQTDAESLGVELSIIPPHAWQGYGLCLNERLLGLCSKKAG
jgi:hypothetical protein